MVFSVIEDRLVGLFYRSLMVTAPLRKPWESIEGAGHCQANGPLEKPLAYLVCPNCVDCAKRIFGIIVKIDSTYLASVSEIEDESPSSQFALTGKFVMEKSPFRILGLETSFGNESAFFHEASVNPKALKSKQEILSMNFDSQAMEEKRVKVRLGDLVPLLMEASESNRMWLRDFHDDIISVPSDLYEVALAYRSMRKAA